MSNEKSVFNEVINLDRLMLYTQLLITPLVGVVNGLGSAIQGLSNSKVDKVTGKGLSTNDYTTAEQTKLLNLTRDYITTCSSAANAQVKVVTADSSFELKSGAIICVKYTNTNTYNATSSAPVQLNVNNTGAKNIYYGSSATPTGTNPDVFGYAGKNIWYQYDGTYWVWMGHGNDNIRDLNLSVDLSTGHLMWEVSVNE